MFERVGVIEALHADPKTDREDAAIEAGAQDVEALEAAENRDGQAGGRFYTEPTDLDAVNKKLAEGGWIISKSAWTSASAFATSSLETSGVNFRSFLSNSFNAAERCCGGGQTKPALLTLTDRSKPAQG